MGVYDTYRDGDTTVQIKVNHGTMDVYELGQSCPLDDGVYIGHEGVVAVRDSKVVGVFTNAYSKWGDELNTRDVIRSVDPITQTVHETLVRQVAADITYKDGYRLVCERDKADAGGRLYFQVQAERVDIVTKEMGTGRGGKAYLSPHQTLSELVRLAYGLFAAYEEHECRENFLWQGHRVFGPHIDVRALAEVSRRFDVRPGVTRA